MRLTCPACGATYDVPDDAIPSAGREVECSECGAVWQAKSAKAAAPGGAGATVEQALARAVRDADPARGEDYLPEDEPAAPDEAREAERAARSGPTPGGEEYLPESAATEDEEEEESAPPFAAAAPPRRKLDDSILRILREEAEREARARAAERAPVETQPELGLTEAPRPRAPAIAPAPPPPPVAPKAPATPETPAPAPAPKPRPVAPQADASVPQNHFGTGFLLALGVAAAALYAYVAAPGIATEFPGLGPALQDYVAAVDAARMWLADAMSQARQALDG